MASSIIGALRVTLGLDAGEFERGAKRARKSADRFGKDLRRALNFAAVGIAVQQLTSRTLQAVKSLDAIAKTADKIGVTTKSLQELRFAASQTGVATRTMEMALQRFVRRTAEAAQGTGEAKAVLEQMGIQLRTNDGRLRSADELLGDVADKLAAVEDQGERVRIAFKLFDSEGVAFLNTLQGGARALDEMRRQALAAGIVLDEKLIRNAEEMNNKLDLSQRIIDAQLNQAFVELAPLVLEATEAFADMSRTLVDVVNIFKRLDEIGTTSIDRNIARLTARIEHLNEMLERSPGTIVDIGAKLQLSADKARLLELQSEKAARTLTEGFEGLRPTIEAARDIMGEIRLSPTLFSQIEQAGMKIAGLFGLVEDGAPGLPAPGEGGLPAAPGVIPPAMPMEKPDFGALADERFTALEEMLTTETERIQQELQTRLAIIQEAERAGLESTISFDELRERAYKELNDRMQAITERRIRTEELLERRKTDTALSAAHQLADGIAALTKEGFYLQRAAAIAETIIQTHRGVQEALPNIPLAALVAAAGAANVAAIAATTIGGGRSTGGAGAANSADTNRGANVGATGAPTGGTTVNIGLTGDSFSREGVIALIDKVNDVVGDGATINVRSGG